MYWKVLRRSLGIIGFELLCHLCSAVGMAKAKLAFDRARVNNVEIGSGSNRRDGFMTVDLALSCDYPFDLRMGLPFPDSSVDLIYAEHVLEHFSIRSVLNLLADCRRVLKPGGRLSVVVPDARIYADAYCSGQDLAAFRAKYCSYEFGLPFESRMDILNYMFYMDGLHKYMFDPENMAAILRSCGFSAVAERQFDGRMDQAARQHESIYFIATRQAAS
jgi:predicted SAM-dependent methyltransferase